MTPPMLERGDLDAEGPQARQLGVEVASVDLKREVMECCSREVDRLPRILRERDGQGLVEEADDLSVTTVSIRDLQEGNSLELLKNVEADDLGVEALDRMEIPHTKDCLAQSSYSWIHGRFRSQDLMPVPRQRHANAGGNRPPEREARREPASVACGRSG